jgi:uracil-DNA glycosylase family 4
LKALERGIVVSTNSLTVWKVLQNEIINCEKCPRLVSFRKEVAREKRKQFRDFNYWGRPVPSNGPLDARLVIIGLAPAAHGGNRTGRMFTGDGSAKFLFLHLYTAGFVNQPISDNIDDGQKLIDCYITAAAHCVPPDNKLKPRELENCSQFLAREFDMLENPKAILALGKVAFDSVIHFARCRYEINGRLEFHHGKKYKIAKNFPTIFASYHPSPRNTQTGKLTSKMFLKVLRDVRKLL